MVIRDQVKSSSVSPTRKLDSDLSGEFRESIPRVRRRSPSADSARKRQRGEHGAPSSSGSVDNARSARYDDSDLSMSRPHNSRSAPALRSRIPPQPSTYGRPVNGNTNPPSSVYGNGYTYGMHQQYNNAMYQRPVLPVQTQQQLNKSRRLYVGNIPFHVGLSDMALTQFFSALYVAGFRPNEPGEPLPVISVWLHCEGKFGFMELRGDQEAVNMMQLNGVVLHGRPLRINRPSDYRPEIHNPAAANLIPEAINIPAIVELCQQLGGIVSPPAQLIAVAAANAAKEQQAREMGVLAGPNHTGDKEKDEQVKGTVIDKHTSNGVSVPSEKAGQSVNAHQSSSRNPPISLNLRSEPSPVKTESAAPRKTVADVGTASVSVSHSSPGQERTEKSASNGNVHGVVISLLNLVTNEDLDGDDEIYEDLVDDVKGECGQYGTVRGLIIPRDGPWKGTAFIEYGSRQEAEAAVNSLRSRVFDERQISAEILEGIRSASAAANREISD